jgi:hypothetical protein
MNNKKKIQLNNVFDFVGLDGTFIHQKLKAKQYDEEIITIIEKWKKDVIELCDENIFFVKSYIELSKKKEKVISQIYKKRGLNENSPEVIECKNSLSLLKKLLK